MLLKQFLNGLALGASMVCGTLELSNSTRGGAHVIGACPGIIAAWFLSLWGFNHRTLTPLLGIMFAETGNIAMGKTTYKPLKNAPGMPPPISTLGGSVFWGLRN